MPASKSAIRTNINRIRGDEDGYEEVPEIKALLDEILTEIPEEDENLSLIWSRLIETADESRIADKIPGTVGRLHKIAYGKVRMRSPKPKLTIKVTDSAVTYLYERMTVGTIPASRAYAEQVEIMDGINKLIHPTAVMIPSERRVEVLSPYAFKKALDRSVRQFDTTKDRAWATQIVEGIKRRVIDAEEAQVQSGDEGDDT